MKKCQNFRINTEIWKMLKKLVKNCISFWGFPDQIFHPELILCCQYQKLSWNNYKEINFPILRFKTTLHIKFDHIQQLFLKFRHFRKTFTKMKKFCEIWTPKTPKKSLFIAFFAHFFSKNGRITRISVKIGRGSPLFIHHTPPIRKLSLTF